MECAPVTKNDADKKSAGVERVSWIDQKSAIRAFSAYYRDHEFVLGEVQKRHVRRPGNVGYSAFSSAMDKRFSGGILSHDEEKGLFSRVLDGVDAVSEHGTNFQDHPQDVQIVLLDATVARQLLISANQGIVYTAAKKVMNKMNTRSMDPLELVNEGNMGLMEAIDCFDVSKGLKLSTYATTVVSRRIVAAVDTQAKVFGLPRHIEEEARKIGYARDVMARTLGHEPTDQEIADEIGCSADRISTVMSAISLSRCVLLGEKMFNNGERDSDDKISHIPAPDDTEATAVGITGVEDVQERAHHILQNVDLSAREKMVVGLMSGLQLMPGGDFEVTRKDGTSFMYSEAVDLLADKMESGEVGAAEIAPLIGVAKEQVRSHMQRARVLMKSHVANVEKSLAAKKPGLSSYN